MTSLPKVSGVLAVEYLIDGWCGISAYTPTICRLLFKHGVYKTEIDVFFQPAKNVILGDDRIV